MYQNRRTPDTDAKTVTCLIVEDEQFYREKFRRVLAQSFPDVIPALTSTIEQARAHMTQFQTSIILLDNSLPDGTGASFALEIRDTPAFAKIPIVIVSDWPTPFMFGKAESAGVIHVVSKSDFDALSIHAAMNQRRPEQRAN